MRGLLSCVKQKWYAPGLTNHTMSSDILLRGRQLFEIVYVDDIILTRDLLEMKDSKNSWSQNSRSKIWVI